MGDYRNGNPDIYMFNLSAKKYPNNHQWFLAGKSCYLCNRIIWVDYRNDDHSSSEASIANSDIYMYHLTTKKETRITTNKSDSVSPDIYGNIIVWEDNHNGNWDIYTYDLVTHQQMHTANKYYQLLPAIYGKIIVWTHWRNGNADIYIGTIS